MAERATQAGNIRETYAFVRSLAPKDARRRPRLRGTDQEVLTRPQKPDLMRQRWSKVYKGKPGRPVPTFTIHFSAEEVVKAIESTKQYKALPQHLAPAGCWKYATVPLAGLLSRTLLASWHTQQVCIPDDWRHAWLVFISKPHKTGHSPSDYRPIALSSPIGKALLGIIQNRLRPYMVREMSHFPQWAYLPFRGVNQALALMYSHCQQVAEAVRAQQISLYDKKAGARRAELCGGPHTVSGSSQRPRQTHTCLHGAGPGPYRDPGRDAVPDTVVAPQHAVSYNVRRPAPIFQGATRHKTGLQSLAICMAAVHQTRQGQNGASASTAPMRTTS